jgi:DNA primase
MDIQRLLATADLSAVFERTGRHLVGRQGRWLMYRCPCHTDRHPSLGITPDRKRWVCFGRCATSGDALNWLQLRLGLDFRQACDELARMTTGVAITASTQPDRLPAGDAPPERWQRAARHVVELVEDKLWSAVGTRARAWLHRRGLDEATLRYWRIGFNPAARRIDGLFVPRGVVIPCIERAQVWSLKLRRASGMPKYVHVADSRPAFFGAHTLARMRVAVICEGEFDAMLLHRYAGDLTGVATLGSASGRLPETWLSDLLPVAQILVAYDADAAGARGAEAWQALSARTRHVSVPDGKDLTDFWCAGGDLRAFVAFMLAKVEVRP